MEHLTKMNAIRHTGNARDVAKGRAKFAQKFIFGLDDPGCGEAPWSHENAGAQEGEITVEAAQNALSFWYAAFKNGEALLMAVCIMPETFDRLAKASDGRSSWWIPIVAAATKQHLLGSQVD